MIRFEQVVKSYGGNVAVDHLDLEAPTGQITCLVGPSGCGKTTTLRMINRMIEPTSGTITIDGKDVTSVAAPELRRGIGYVIQHGGLFPHQKVLDNVGTVPRLRAGSVTGWGCSPRTVKGAAPSMPSRSGAGPRRSGALTRSWPGTPQRICMASPFSIR